MQRHARIDAAVRDLMDRGVQAASAAPPALRLLWRLGATVPPPHFMTFWQNAFVSGSTFVLLWFAAAWCLEAVVGWAPPGHTLPALVLRGSVVGVIFGVGMAAYYRSQAQALNLPNWSEYVPPNQDDAA